MSTASSTLQPTPSSTAPPATTSTPPGSGDGGNTKPFLFFVALGFGVVFANLWIIVGVKYCFRYNNRARQALIDQENANSNVDLGAVPPQRRRRREKKLMTMDEVNERFPLTRYKVWRATREQEGLPAEGGISAPPSRAASIRAAAAEERDASETTAPTPAQDPAPATTLEVDNKPADHAEKKTASVEVRPATEPDQPTQLREYFSSDHDSHSQTASAQANQASDATQAHGQGLSTTETPAGDSTTDLSTADDDPIQGALPESMLEQTNPGDNCAICIDSLDEDDEVRGLTCGHAFHASCVDPWLTSRRASCPLCKQDYYVPKPRPDGSDPTASTLPQPPPALITRPHMLFGGFRANAPDTERERPQPGFFLFGLAPPTRGQMQREERQQRQQRHRERRARRQQQQAEQRQQDTEPGIESQTTGETAPTPSMFQRVGQAVRAPRTWLPRRARPEQPSTTAGSEAPSTPAQLEAGTPAR